MSQGFMPQTSRMAMNPPSGLAFSARSAKNCLDFLPQGADLPLEDGFSVLIADIYRKLVLVLVDTEI